jgi:hypothetical protein
MNGESTHEVLVDRSGRVRDVRIVGTTFMVFALASDAALRAGSFYPATLDGKAVGSRFWMRVPFGVPTNIESSPARNRVTAFVPGDEPVRARWQLTGSVHRVTVVGDVASAPPAEVSVVAIAPGGATQVLVPAGRIDSKRFRMTVKTGNFFSKPGEYRLRLQQNDRPISEGGFTVAEDESSALVNACGAE